MTMTKIKALALVTAVLALTAICPAENAPEARLREAIEAIQQSDSVRAAGEAYGGAASEAGDSAELRDVYMRKLLALDAVDLAVSPARTLVSLDRNNGVAWALIGRHAVKQGRTAEALAATANAVILLGDEPGVMYNAGQLMAWLDNETDLPELDEDAVAALAAAGEEWSSQEAFKEGYELLQRGYDQHRQIIETAQNLHDEIEDQLAETKAEYEELVEAVDRQKAQVDHLAVRIRNADKDDVDIDHEDYQDLQDARDELARLGVRKSEVKREGVQLTRDLGRAADDIERAQRNRQQVFRDAGAEFAFRVPAHDAESTGVLPETDLDVLDSPTTNGSAGGGGSDGTTNEPDSADQESQRLLRKAKLYLNGDMNDKAAEILRELLEKYPESDEAEEAQALLNGL